MKSSVALRRIQSLVSNQLPEVGRARFLGILGDEPSRYAKSPTLWNHAIRALGWESVYLAFDIPPGGLGELVEALRDTPSFLGGNVTVPYKREIVEHLDKVDTTARAIGAVNTIAREGTRLVGYNTDGLGALEALTAPQPGEREPFVPSLDGRETLLVGAGGAARAISHYVGRSLNGGVLHIANRTLGRASELAEELRNVGVHAEPLAIHRVEDVIERTTLIINATSVGQSGLRSLPNGGHTVLEAYSPLAPTPVVEMESDSVDGMAEWSRRALDGVTSNNRASWELILRAPPDVRCFDAIYAPLETTFLRQARLSGRKTLNGKAMNLAQAVAAFRLVWSQASPEVAEPSLWGKVGNEMERVW